MFVPHEDIEQYGDELVDYSHESVGGGTDHSAAEPASVSATIREGVVSKHVII